MRCPRHDWFETGVFGWGRDPDRPVLRCANCRKKRGMTPHEYELWGEGYTWKVMGVDLEPQTENEPLGGIMRPRSCTNVASKW